MARATKYGDRGFLDVLGTTFGPPPGAADLTGAPGAYLLCLTLADDLPIELPRLAGYRLAPGQYAYAGSAYGPGGLSARIGRHLRSHRKSHWHIDHVTAHAGTLWAWPFPGGRECELIARLLATGCFDVPIPGFGASDCRDCQSHFLHWRAPVDVAPERPSA